MKDVKGRQCLAKPGRRFVQYQAVNLVCAWCWFFSA